MQDWERKSAEANAPRMAHMSDADIRTAIASLNDERSAPSYGIATRMVVQREDADELSIYRTELVRRACADLGLPFLTHLDMTALRQAAADGKVRHSDPGIILKCLELCLLGLMTERTRDLSGVREFRLTPLGQQVVDNSSDDAFNLLDAVREAGLRPSVSLDTVAALVCADIAASYAESIRADDAPALMAAE